MIEPNVAKQISFALIGNDGLPNIASTPLVLVAQDDGNYVQATNSPVQKLQDTTPTCGWYCDLTDDEMDGELVEYLVTATDCLPIHRVIYPEADWTAAKAAYLDAAISDAIADIAAASAAIQADIAAVLAAVLAKFATTTVSASSPVSDTGTIEFYRGVDYSDAIGNAIEFALPVATHGDLTSATVVLQTDESEFEATVVNANTANQLARIELTAAETTALTARASSYLLLATLADGTIPDPKAGGVLVVRDFPQPVEAE